MSGIIKLATPMVDLDSLVAAIKNSGQGGIQVRESGTDLEVIRDGLPMRFTAGSIGYQLECREDWRTPGLISWLAEVHALYAPLYIDKLARLKAEERARVEAEKARMRAEQERLVVEKAKSLGYRVDKRAEKDGSVRLVLVRKLT
ncbi:MAG: hypothetical protein JNG85_05820 [Spirochaetaceae bacterium]|nr:hypothetical protein [Spirochaetaceae bacterium]